MTDSDAFAFFGTLSAIFIAPIIVFMVLYVIGLWKILEKGGKPAWGALIPFYGQYLLCEMVGVNTWWIAIVLIAPLLPVAGNTLSSLTAIYFSVLLNISLAKSFDKDESYGIGLLFLAPVFYLMLGTGKEKYSGPNPMKDIIFDNIAGTKNTNKTSGTRFCTSCGTKLEPGAKFCTKCGKEVK